MKKISIIAMILLMSVMAFALPAKAYNDIEVRDYIINMDVREDGKIHIEQTLVVNFATQHHGIYAVIPQTYEMEFKGETKRYFFPVTNINVEKFPHKVNTQLDGVSIQIGDPNQYVKGLVTYKYSYDIQTRDLGLDNQQFFYFNLVGSGWEMPILNTQFTINFPKEITQTPQFYPPTNSKTEVDYQFDGKKLTGTFADKIAPGKALTVYLDLEQGYFVFAKSTSLLKTMQVGFLAIFTLLTIGLFFKYGRDRPLVKTVEFKAPDNMSSAQVGYVVDNMLQQRDITSLLIYWASKGYLSIKEVSETKFEFTKLKEIDDTQILPEQALFKAFFGGNDVVKSDKLPKSYYIALSRFQMEMMKYYRKSNALFESKSSGVRALTSIILWLSIALYTTTISYDYFGILSISMVVGVITFVFAAIVSFFWFITLTNRGVRKKMSNVSLIIISIILSAFFVIVMFTFANYVSDNYLYMVVLMVLMAINIIPIAFMAKRTKQGQTWLGQILGLKDFIEVAEKDRIEMLINDNPEYFFEILPYAYVLNVTDEWIKRFEGINIMQPNWYQTNTPFTSYLFVAHMTNSLRTMNTSMSIPMGNATGKGGFGGGGFSGGFSGGGFGGGGGGGW